MNDARLIHRVSRTPTRMGLFIQGPDVAVTIAMSPLGTLPNVAALAPCLVAENQLHLSRRDTVKVPRTSNQTLAKPAKLMVVLQLCSLF